MLFNLILLLLGFASGIAVVLGRLSKIGEIVAVKNFTALEVLAKAEKIIPTIVFQAVFTFFGLFIITSSGSSFGNGLVMGVLGAIIFKQTKEIKINKRLADSWYYYLVKEKISSKQEKIWIAIMAVILLVMLLRI